MDNVREINPTAEFSAVTNPDITPLVRLKFAKQLLAVLGAVTVGFLTAYAVMP